MKILSKSFVTLGLLVGWISISASTIASASPEDSGYSTDKLNALKDKLDPYVEDGRLPNYLLSLYHKGNLIYEAKKGHVDVALEKLPVMSLKCMTNWILLAHRVPRQQSCPPLRQSP